MKPNFRRCYTCNMTALGHAGLTVAKRGRSCIFCILVLSLAGGCVPVPRGHNPLELRFMSTEELREYSEQVFREQNRLITRLMMAPMRAGSVTPEQRRRVQKAEASMNEACASLNTIASARAQGKDSDVELENRVRRDVRECAQQTERLKALLDEFEIGRSRQKSSFESDQSSPDRFDSNQALSMNYLQISRSGWQFACKSANREPLPVRSTKFLVSRIPTPTR